MTHVEELLSKMYLFADFSPAELAKVAALVKVDNLGPGHSLYLEGSAAQALYIVRSGQVKVVTSGTNGDDINLITIGPGEHFGELPFLDGERRSAGIDVVQPSEVLEIAYDDLRTLIDGDPAMAVKLYRDLGVYLVKRYRALSADITKAREVRRRYS